jgi:hypothetical protein
MGNANVEPAPVRSCARAAVGTLDAAAITAAAPAKLRTRENTWWLLEERVVSAEEIPDLA